MLILDFLICPGSTIHQALAYVEPRSPLSWLHIAEVEHALEPGFRRLGLTATRYLIEGEIYPEKLAVHGLEHVRPNTAERGVINRIVFGQLVYGVSTADAVAYFRQVIGRMKKRSRDAVVLGCTEIEFSTTNARFHTLAGASRPAPGRRHASNGEFRRH
jgi:aspartate racemase